MNALNLNIVFKFLDFLLRPFMYVLQGTVNEKPQETHPWHVKRFVWKNKGILIEGTDHEARFGQSGITKNFGFFHIPILGGLKNM